VDKLLKVLETDFPSVSYHVVDHKVSITYNTTVSLKTDLRFARPKIRGSTKGET
jgi:hypothetical protein